MARSISSATRMGARRGAIRWRLACAPAGPGGDHRAADRRGPGRDVVTGERERPDLRDAQPELPADRRHQDVGKATEQLVGEPPAHRQPDGAT